jgi:DNA-binding transcriptional regulator YiaG
MAMASDQHKSQFTDGRILWERGAISIADIRANLGISRERMGRVLDVSARTIQRWEDNNQLPANRWVMQVLVQLQNIVDVGLEVFTPEGLHRVMTNPQPGFNNRSGLDLFENGEGETVFGEFVSADEGYLGR